MRQVTLEAENYHLEKTLDFIRKCRHYVGPNLLIEMKMITTNHYRALVNETSFNQEVVFIMRKCEIFAGSLKHNFYCKDSWIMLKFGSSHLQSADMFKLFRLVEQLHGFFGDDGAVSPRPK